MVINTNTDAMRNANNLNASQANLAKALARLSSGDKIIYANDYASFELPSSDTTPCAQACCEDSRCFGWSVDDPIP